MMTQYGYTPLMVASAMNEFGAAKFLISRGADLHAVDEVRL
jgi:ankyrin repeat protein